MMPRCLLTLALFLLPGLFFVGEAAAQAKLYAGPQTGKLYLESGPRLLTALFPRHRLDLRSSGGAHQTLEMVLADPDAIGFVQKDILRDHLTRRPADTKKVQLFGNLGARCLYGVVREGGWVAGFDDLLRPRDGRPLRVDVGAPDGDAAATFAVMRSVEPGLDHVELEHRSGLRALHMVEAGLTDMAFFVDEPRLDSPEIAKVMESDVLALVPMVSRALLAADEHGESSYVYTRVVVDRNVWLRRETSYETLCTPVGIVVNTAGDPAFLDAVAFASISGDLTPRDPSLVDRLLHQVDVVRGSVMQLLQRF